MGVDAKFFVRTEIGPEEVMEALKALGKKNVEWKHTTVAPGYLNIFFDSEQKDWNKRMIHLHLNVKDEYFWYALPPSNFKVWQRSL